MTIKPLHEHQGSVAVIGMAARFPGAKNVAEYWRNLCEGVESIQRHTREEALSHGMTTDQVDSPSYVNASASLDDVDCFDGAFFGYSARESAVMEPQHRIFLECAYHAMEDAGYDGHGYHGRVGVYAGCTMNTYLVYNLLGGSGDAVAMVGDMATMLGNDKDFLATRVSYKLNLRGPSFAVQRLMQLVACRGAPGCQGTARRRLRHGPRRGLLGAASAPSRLPVDAGRHFLA